MKKLNKLFEQPRTLFVLTFLFVISYYSVLLLTKNDDFLLGLGAIIFPIWWVVVAKKSWSSRFRKNMSITIWSLVLLVSGLTVYVNYALPHGKSYPTGDYVCQNDDRGPCKEKYIEDLRDVPIAGWAKYWRREWEGYWMLLLFIGIIVSTGKQETDSA